MRYQLVALLLLVPAVQAEPVSPLPAFSQGRYTEAAQAALQDETADSYAFAARAFLAEAVCMNGRQPPANLLDQAGQAARQALELDPGHPEAKLQLAITLSLKARGMSIREALQTGWVGAARDLALSVLRDDEDNFYAHGFLAVWHLEVVRRGGRLGAAMLGASVGTAREHYWKTRAIRDGDPATSWQYARALAAIDPGRYDAEIRSVLQRAIQGEARDALEQTMQLRAEAFYAALSTVDTAELRELARSQL